MLYLMKSYQSTLKNPDNLASSIKLLEMTSQIMDIFCSRNRPISSQEDTAYSSQLFQVMGKCCEEISYACPLQTSDDSGDSNRPRLRTHGIYIPLQEYAQWET